MLKFAIFQNHDKGLAANARSKSRASARARRIHIETTMAIVAVEIRKIPANAFIRDTFVRVPFHSRDATRLFGLHEHSNRINNELANFASELRKRPMKYSRGKRGMLLCME